MGLNKFKNSASSDNEQSNSLNESRPQDMEIIESAKAINILTTIKKLNNNLNSMDVDNESLQKELYACDKLDEIVKIITSWPSSKEWNVNKDYFTSIYRSNISQNTSLTSKDIYCKAGAHPAKLNWNNRNEYKVYGDMYYAALLYGDDFTAKQLNSKSGLTSNHMIKKSLGLTFNELKDDLSFKVNRYSDLTKNKVSSILSKKFNEKEIITYRKINNKCDDISGSMVANRFGDGSLAKGLRELGVDESQISSKNATTENNYSRLCRNQLNELDYDEKADGYVYLLRCITDIEENAYYVGSVGNNKSLVKRIEQHMRMGGDFKANKKIEDSYCVLKREEFSWGIEIMSITEVYKQEMSQGKFKEHISSIEMRKHNELCSKLDGLVFGGK
jgi:hypothetical protein